MTWIKIDDGMPEHPKFVGLSEGASWLFLCGLAFSSRRLTDGKIPGSMLNRLGNVRQPARRASELVQAGLWEVTDDGWQVIGYDQHQRTRAQVEAERESGAERQRRWRASRSSNGAGNGVTPPLRNALLTRPELETETETEPLTTTGTYKKPVENPTRGTPPTRKENPLDRTAAAAQQHYADNAARSQADTTERNDATNIAGIAAARAARQRNP